MRFKSILILLIPCMASMILGMSCTESDKDDPVDNGDVELDGKDLSAGATKIDSDAIYIYTLSAEHSSDGYDEAVAASCIQGLLNRDHPCVFLKCATNPVPETWLNIFSSGDGWLSGRKQIALTSFDELLKLGFNEVRGIIIWDTDVPATLNVATTMAGIKNAIVMSPEFAEKYQSIYDLPVIKDFRGQFDGSVTGSKKNDAYRWAISNFMDKGLCNTHRICLYTDPYTERTSGTINYVVTRDWAVYGKCFVFDLSPWGDERPADDPQQPLGTDLETYKLLLQSVMDQAAGREMTEVAGFFSFSKYSNSGGNNSNHEPVATEWETVYLISYYNCYQNTVADNCYNQSFHSQAPQKVLKQGRPILGSPQNGKTYIAILMADYDSATPLYDFLLSKGIWLDEGRGKIPLLWGINPNLCETYPDIIQYLYSTRTPNDWFAADASCAGYFNPNRVREAYLPLFTQHNKKFYQQLDMSISPMVLDINEPSTKVKDAFAEFSPDGFATIVGNSHGGYARLPDPQVWKGMPITKLINNTCNFYSVENEAEIMSDVIKHATDDSPRFYLFRIVWTSPTNVYNTIKTLEEKRPDLDLEVLDAYNFFHFYKSTLE